MIIRKDGQNYQAYYELAVCLNNMQRDEEAVQNIDMCLKINPDFTEALKL